ncbi:nucleoside hydrolase 3-like [Castanea sativa]|uniref:nucleoside hydrolase 3-like n=1 Tax=Castanea sativa TaxID=21020 RepID=UPI003F650F5C
MRMLLQGKFWVVVLMIIGVVGANLYYFLFYSFAGANLYSFEGLPHRILLDTDVDTDDLLGLLYLLKLNRSEFNVEAVTISANGWSDAGHAVNQIYDILYMMDRDDVAVGVGGDGGILEDGTILPNVGGYLPLIEQGYTTAGYCRYRQANPVGRGGRLDLDANFGIRKAFLPQGRRNYTPLWQPTAQQVMIDRISAGPITVLLIGTCTNFAIFLMSNPHLKKNIKHIYIMGGGVRTKNPTGNLFTDYTSNPYAESNIFGDPFAAYQVFHSGIPITLVPLDATNSIPISKNFFNTFEQSQNTYEAQYCFQSLKTARDASLLGDQFYTEFFMWDSFASGVAASIMSKSNNPNGENEFAEMEYMNITVVTSNEPYGMNDGSNLFFDGLDIPRFNLTKGGVHSGHVQTGLRDPFCVVKNGKGKCQDGYTAEVTGPEAVHILVATDAKPNQNNESTLNRQFYRSFLDVINCLQHTGRFNFTTQFPYYKEVLYKPDFGSNKLGKPVVFDMDMSAGDFLTLFYLLKVPVEVINLKAIIVSPTGWASAATIDIIYDLLHMMGRDDIPVGLGDIFAMNQSDAFFSSVGDCKYIKAIPHGSGGLIDSDTLYGLARDLPRSPRRYTQENSVKEGAPQKQPLALEVWKSVVNTLDPGSKITILTNGPLTNLAKIILSEKNTTSLYQDVYIVGGHISRGDWDKGNVFTIHSNEFSEFNMFLDPLAAKTVFDSNLNITLIPLGIQRRVGSLPRILKKLQETKRTPEAKFASQLLSMLYGLQQSHVLYHHVDIFSQEILGALVLAGDMKPTMQVKPVKVFAEGVESTDGQTMIDEKDGKLVKILEDVNYTAYYDLFANRLNDLKQSAVIGSFDEQRRLWSRPPK